MVTALTLPQVQAAVPAAGLYPICTDGQVLCWACFHAERKLITEAAQTPEFRTGWELAGFSELSEGHFETCANCYAVCHSGGVPHTAFRAEIKGNPEQVRKAISDHGMGWVRTVRHSQEFHSVLCILNSAGLEALGMWLAEPGQVLPGFGYPPGTLLHFAPEPQS